MNRPLITGRNEQPQPWVTAMFVAIALSLFALGSATVLSGGPQ